MASTKDCHQTRLGIYYAAHILTIYFPNIHLVLSSIFKSFFSTYVLAGDLQNLKSYCHALCHISAASLTGLFVETRPKSLP